MRKKIVIAISVFLILQFVKGWCIEAFKNEHGESRIEYLAIEAEGIDYDRLVRSSKAQNLLPIALKQKRVNVLKIDEPTVAIGVTASYIQLEHLNMIEGSFIVDQAVQEQRNVVVISKQVAIKLFRTTKIIGKTVRCNEQLYKVVGVYEERKHIWEKMCDDGYEVIYIPITDSVFEGAATQQVIINGKYDHMPSQAALNQLGLNDNTIKEYDYSYWEREMQGIYYLPIVFLGIICCILFDKKLWHQAKEKGVWKQQSDEFNWKSLLNTVTISLVVIGINIVVIYLSTSHFYMNPSSLPPENIFDISFYWKQLCDRWINQNLYRRESISTYGNLLMTFKKTIHMINLLQYIGVGVILVTVKTMIKSRNQSL